MSPHFYQTARGDPAQQKSDRSAGCSHCSVASLLMTMLQAILGLHQQPSQTEQGMCPSPPGVARGALRSVSCRLHDLHYADQPSKVQPALPDRQSIVSSPGHQALRTRYWIATRVFLCRMPTLLRTTVHSSLSSATCGGVDRPVTDYWTHALCSERPVSLEVACAHLQGTNEDRYP